jgi:regulator of replication initiation timing
MSINPTIQLAQATSKADEIQLGIADLERRMDASLLGSTVEDQTALRLELSKLKALLGEVRNQEAFWRDQVAQNTSSRKEMGELTKAA